LGINVTSKVIYGAALIKNVKLQEIFGGTEYSIGDEGNIAFGCSLAVGYDFSKRDNVPVRGELEYAAPCFFNTLQPVIASAMRRVARGNTGIRIEKKASACLPACP